MGTAVVVGVRLVVEDMGTVMVDVVKGTGEGVTLLPGK